MKYNYSHLKSLWSGVGLTKQSRRTETFSILNHWCLLLWLRAKPKLEVRLGRVRTTAVHWGCAVGCLVGWGENTQHKEHMRWLGVEVLRCRGAEMQRVSVSRPPWVSALFFSLLWKERNWQGSQEKQEGFPFLLIHSHCHRCIFMGGCESQVRYK